MNTNDLIKLFLDDDKKNPYKNITFKIDAVKYIGYKTIFNLPDLKVNTIVGYEDIYKMFKIPKIKYNNLYEFLHYRDVLNNESYTINAIEHITKDINFNEYIISGILDVKKLFKVIYNNSMSESNEEEEKNTSSDSDTTDDEEKSSNLSKKTQINVEFLTFIELFKRIGFIAKDKRTNTIAEDVLTYIKKEYTLEKNDSSDVVSEDTKQKSDVINLKINKIKRAGFDISKVIPKGTCGTIIRYLKLYNPIHEKNPSLTKPEFKNILLSSGFVIIRDKKLMYIKEKEIDFSNFIFKTFTE